jgi:hypothetical protein
MTFHFTFRVNADTDAGRRRRRFNVGQVLVLKNPPAMEFLPLDSLAMEFLGRLTEFLGKLTSVTFTYSTSLVPTAAPACNGVGALVMRGRSVLIEVLPVESRALGIQVEIESEL